MRSSIQLSLWLIAVGVASLAVAFDAADRPAFAQDAATAKPRGDAATGTGPIPNAAPGRQPATESVPGSAAGPRPTDIPSLVSRTGRLPADSRTAHVMQLGDRRLSFSATVGSIPLTTSSGRVLAEVVYTAYTLDDAAPRTRPVTFAFNGGPGSASTWLHLGAMGPWRIPLTPGLVQPSTVPVLIDNAETWLGFTDLVFIDPVGTGYSRLVESVASPVAATQSRRGGGRRSQTGGSRDSGGAAWFWSLRGDVVSIAEVIERWLRGNGRLASPKMIAGESYGGFRVPRIARLLQHSHGIGINAMVLLSPVLDFADRRSYQPTYHMHLLPSLAAATMERQGKIPTRQGLATVEDYARGSFVGDLLLGPRDTAAVARIIANVSSFTGVAPDRVRRYGGRLSARAYMREMNSPSQRLASLYDASLTGFDPFPAQSGSRFADPFTVGLAAPMTSAMLQLYSRLGWRLDRQYELLSSTTNQRWRWGNSPNPPESISTLKEVLALDPSVRVLVTHGFTDLVTPYFASVLQLAQLPSFGDPSRIRLKVYRGGHMHYSRNGTRAALQADAEEVLREALTPPAP